MEEILRSLGLKAPKTFMDDGLYNEEEFNSLSFIHQPYALSHEIEEAFKRESKHVNLAAYQDLQECLSEKHNKSIFPVFDDFKPCFDQFSSERQTNQNFPKNLAEHLLINEEGKITIGSNYEEAALAPSATPNTQPAANQSISIA